MNQTGTININSQPNSNNNKPADHRGSDASDASTGHLMVYEDLSARRSSISFDKIRQISLSYSLQSEDAGDTDTVLERPGAGSGVVDIGAGGDGQQDAARRCVVQNSSVPVLLPNGCSDIIMTNNDEPAARTTTNGRGQDRIERPAGSVVEAQAAPKDAPHSDAPRAMDVDRLIGTSNSKNGLPAAAAETGAATNSLGAGLEACRQHRNQSAGAGDASTDQAAGGAARRNPFVVYSDDEALVQDKQVACALPKQEAKFSPAAKLEANRLNQSRSPTRSQQYKTSSSTSNNNNNNSTISLKLAKNMGANIIIDSDKHIALIQGSDRRRSSYEPTDINQEDLDQFSSDNSSSCWDCASGPTTTQRRVVVGGGQGHEEARPNLPAGPMTPSGRRRRQQQQQQTRSDLLETDYRRAASLTPEVDSANTIRNGNGDGGTTNSSNNNLNNRLDQLQLALDNRQHYQEALVSKGPGRLTSARPASKQPNPRDPNARASPSRAPGPPETVLAGSQLMSRRPVGGAGQKHRGAAYSTTSDHQHHRHQTRTTNGQIYARDDEVDYDYDEDDVDEGDDNDEEEEEDRLASDNSRPFFDNADYEQLAGADEMLVVTSDRSDRSDARVGLIPPVVGGRQCAGDEGGERPNGHNGGAHQDRFLNCSPGRTARQPLRAATMPQMETGVGSTASADRLKRELRTPVRPKLPSPLLQQERRAREPMRTYAPPDATSRGGRELRARPEELADDYLTATAAVSKDLKGQSQPQQPRRRRQRMMEDQPFYDGQHQQHWTPARRDATEAASSGGSGGRYSEMAAIAQARASSLGRGTPMTGAARHFDYVGRQRDNDDDDDPAGGDRGGGAGAADGPPVGFDDDIDWALATTPRRWRPQWRDHRGSSGDRGTAAVWGATRVVDESSQHRQGTPADERGARRKHGELAGGSSWRPGASPQRAPMGRHQFAPAECGVCQQPLVAAARKSGSGDNLRIRPSPTHRGGRRPMNQPTTALTTNEKEAATRTALVLDNDDDEGEDEEEDRLELELDETKQISIIIGTPKRRHSSRQKRYQNSGSSTASTMTPPPLVRRQDDFYYYDDYHHRPADFVDVGQAWPHWATSGASAAAGQQQWRRRRPSFDYPARPEQDDNNMNQEQRQQRSRQRRLAAAAGGGRTTYAFGGNDYESTTSIATNTAARRGRRHEARWPPLGASDNFELVQSAGLVGDGSGAAGWGLQNSEATTSAADSIETSTIGGVGVSVGSRMKQKPRELSRRSTISSSSEGGGCLAVATDSQEDAQRVQSGAQFQRRPTGPFEVGHHPAGGQQQQPMMTLAKMRLQQPQQQQPQLLQQANQQKQQQPYDDHCDSRTVAEGHGKAADSTSSVTPSGVASLPPPPPPASEQINLDARTANKMHHPPAAATAAPTTATAAATAATSPEKPAPKPPVPAQDQKPIKLRNLLTKEVTVDSLHLKNTNRPVGCRETSCLGSIIDPVPVEHRVRTPDETRAQAKEFIDGYYASIKRFDTPAHKNRLLEIEEQINTTDTYYLRETELIYGAKLAWRNAPRCIGRIQWSKLQVFDARCTRTADEMFEAICNHIKYATNKGNLRSAITIFPQRVKSTQNDWRVWNPQLIGYAGYKDKETGKVIGDPLNVDLTEICQKLGWQGKGGQFDILPLVLQANGGPPKLFKLPEELVLRVKLRHPKLDWFQELGLEWYAVPAVSNMMLDLGGLQFTACPFNGWYMVTEVGARDLGDTNRYNVLEPIAQRMGLNTTTNMSLWRDQALTQLNLAVLYSYQQSGVTIVDHHTACETFMTHLKNEQRLRGGCPADWVWLVPPTAGSTTQVFHQEMVNYHLMPNYEYLQPAWKNFDWIKWERAREESRASKAALISAGASGGVGGVGGAGTMGSPASKLSLMSTIKAGGAAGGVGAGMSPLSKLRLGMNQSASGALVGSAAAGGSSSPASSAASPSSQIELTPRHLRFKEIARAVKFTSKLFGKALSRRIKATILYATETGKSERFANKLAQTFSHAFNVHLMSMSDYDMTCLEHEALLLIVTSTFGNGDPPENGELFAKHLAAIKMTGDSSPDIDSINSVSTNPFFQMLSEDHKDGLSQAASGGASGSSGTGDGPLGGDSLQAPGGSGDNSLTSGANRGHDDSDDTASSSSSSSGSNPSLSSISKRRQDGDDDGDCGLAVSPPAIQTLPPTSPPSTAATTTITTTTTTTNGTDRKQRASTLVRQADSISCQQLNQEQQTNIRPLSNVRFAVFALGSTAYPHFCAFGRYVDQTLGELGAERILKCCCGDELSGQEKALTEWSQEVFKVACDVFCLTDTMEPIDDRPEALWTPQDVRFEYVEEGDEVGLATPTAAGSGGVVVSTPPSSSSSKSSIIQNLAGIVGKKILPFSVRQRLDLHEFIPEEGLQTIRVDLDSGLKPVKFQPGDHIGIYPVNKFEVVDKILKRIEQDLKLAEAAAAATSAAAHQAPTPRLVHNMDKKVSILLKRGKMDPLTQGDDWIRFDTLPLVSIREALTRYLDITNAPNQDFLSILARQTNDPEDKKRLQQMARNFTIYEEWKNKQAPSLLSTLEEFKSVCFDPALITQIPPMKPRFYSVSGTSITLTLGVVRYKTSSGEPREGLCSNYLNTVPADPRSYVFGYVRSAPAFHMPQDKSVPMLLISAGTGIAPFRSFWQQRYSDMNQALTGQQQQSEASQQFGRIEFYFGCRNSRYILYKDELDDMHNKGVLSSINIAFSRPLDRDVIEQVSDEPGAKATDVLSSPPPQQQPHKSSSRTDSIKQARKRMYVQDKLLENHKLVFKSIVHDGAHIYVCGDVAMADGVYKTLAKVININLKANNKLARQTTSGHDHKSPNSGALTTATGGSTCTVNKGVKIGSVDLVRSGEDGESVLMNLRNLNRYHEDIFGAKQV